MEKKVGRPTSFVARSTVSRTLSSVACIYAFEMPEGVFRDHNAGVDEHSNGNRNSRQ